jgi:calpain-15
MREKDRQGLAQFLEPKDIIQGSLGDCYFLSSISSLVEYYPELLSELFLFDINPSGMYVVRLFNDGEWSSIVLDDRFPCVYGRPIFAKPHGNEIWVLLLEKAWAKLHGSYQSIDLGSSMEALIALTGAPCKFYRKEDDDIKKAIEEGFRSGSVVTCSGSDELNDLPAAAA